MLIYLQIFKRTNLKDNLLSYSHWKEYLVSPVDRFLSVCIHSKADLSQTSTVHCNKQKHSLNESKCNRQKNECRGRQYDALETTPLNLS